MFGSRLVLYTPDIPAGPGFAGGFDVARLRASCVCSFNRGGFMIGDDDTAAIDPPRSDVAPSGKLDICTRASGAQPDITADPLTEWGQRAMARAKELRGNDALRREVAKRSF
jgi:hypothetical protein